MLDRNIAEVLPSKKSFEERLQKGPVKIYLGIDPSGSQIHLGHAVVLWKLKEFQDGGHKVILLIGDFTGMIGDPTDKSAARKKLTEKEVQENAKTYKEQVSKILNFEGENPAEIKFNSQWLAKLSFADILELASNFTAQQILERDFFQARLKENKPIHLHEFMYPLMQGYDSVAMEVDAEIGGTDQTFNMLVGRTLLEKLKGREKFVVTVPLLEGLDGRKMSKSYENFIAITDTPGDMFGKVMSLQDDLIVRYFGLITHLDEQEIQSIEQGLQSNKLHPMEAKKRLAWETVKLYHGEEAANKARDNFEEVFQKGSAPKEARTYTAKADRINIVETLVESGIIKSKSDARRLFDQGAIEINGEKAKNMEIDVPESGLALRIGKHRFLRIKRTG